MPNDISELLKKTVTATGTVELVASANAEGGETQIKSMRIEAYNGGLINVGWRLPVGVELSGLKWRDDSAIPILCLHNSHSIEAVCGQAKKIDAANGHLVVDADFMPVTDTAKQIHALAKAGFKFQASVGVSPSDILYVDEDTTAILNGKEVKGECYIVRDGTLNEVSIVPLGADGSTATSISAAKQTGKEPTMATPEKKIEAEKPEITVEAAQNAERDRVASVIKACEGHADIMAQAVKEGWTAEKAELACLKAEKAEAEKAAKQAKIEGARPSAPSIIDPKASAPKDAKTVVAAICMGAAMKDSTVEAMNKGVDLDAAHDLGIHRLSDVFAAFGFNYRAGNDNEMRTALKAAFSTVDIPNILSNAASKFADTGFGSVGEDWRKVSRSIPVKDFKAITGVRLRMGGTLQPLAKGGELKHATLADEARSLAAATKGIMLGITREDLINDDLGILSTIPFEFGQMSGRTINKDVFAVIAALQANDFGANTTGALTVDSLAAAYALAMTIKDGEDFIGSMPNTILVHPANFITAKNIYLSEKMVGGTSKSPDANPMRSTLEPITSAYLGTGTSYYLFNSTMPLVDVAFLNGRQTPVVETANVDFSQLGIQMRCYFDYGCAAGKTKAALMSTGA